MNSWQRSAPPGTLLRHRWINLAALLTAALLIPAKEATCQEPEAAGRVRSLRLGQRVRVEAQDQRLQGLFMGVTQGKVTILADSGTTHTPLGGIDRIWVRGRSTTKGLLVGGVAGAIVGAIYGLLIEDVVCGETGCSTGEIAAITGLLGGTSGAAVGGVAGYFVPRWSVRFP